MEVLLFFVFIFGLCAVAQKFGEQTAQGIYIGAAIMFVIVLIVEGML